MASMVEEREGRSMPPWMRESSTFKPTMRPSMLGLPLPLGTQSSSSGNPFNLAKARADAAAASFAGSRASSYRSRRQSVGSQMSHLSYSSKRSMRSGKSGRYGRAGKSFKIVEIAEPDIVQVFDEHGNDVTPKPLTVLRATPLHERLLQINTDRFTPESERPSVYSRYSMASSLASFTPDTLDNEGADKDEGDPSLMRWNAVAVVSKDSGSHFAENQRRIHLIHSRVTAPAAEQVRWSPFIPSLFLSCSSDWTVRLWQEDKDTALLVFQSATQSLQDLRWSFTNACVFGTVSDDGHLEIWDLSLSAVKPTIVFEEKRRLSCVLFCQTSPIVVSAGNNGAASVFRLRLYTLYGVFGNWLQVHLEPRRLGVHTSSAHATVLLFFIVGLRGNLAGLTLYQGWIRH